MTKGKARRMKISPTRRITILEKLVEKFPNKSYKEIIDISRRKTESSELHQYRLNKFAFTYLRKGYLLHYDVRALYHLLEKDQRLDFLREYIENESKNEIVCYDSPEKELQALKKARLRKKD